MRKIFVAVFLASTLASSAHAASITFDSWQNGPGNYVVTVSEGTRNSATTFDVTFRADNQTANITGLFFNFSPSFGTANPFISSPLADAGGIVMDVCLDGRSCGRGDSNLNGISINGSQNPVWDLVFRVDGQGSGNNRLSEGSFSFLANDLTLDDFYAVGLRAQGDKLWSAEAKRGAAQIPEPETLALLGIGLAGLAAARRLQS
jgi:hypothetical protein